MSIILFLGYLRRTLNYLKKIRFFNLTHMMSMTNLMAIGMEIPMIDNVYSLEKEFSKLIHLSP